MSHSDIFLAIEARLRSGELLPGAQILEGQLMQEFGVSRTPVRDAILRLHALDYLSISPRKGIFVTRLTVRQVLEQLEVLAHLEGLCTQLAAQRMRQAERERLLALQQTFAQAALQAQVQEYAQANHDFHALLYEGCRNEYLVQQILQLRTRTAAYRLKRFESQAGLQRSQQEHAAIAAAVSAADESRAYQAALAHINMGGEEYAELVRQLPEDLFASTPAQSRRPASAEALTRWSFGIPGDLSD